MNLDCDAIFRVIQCVFRTSVGTKAAIAMNERIDSVLKRERLWDEIDLADVIEEVWDWFGLTIAKEARDAFCGVGLDAAEWEEFAARQFTFSALVELVAAELAKPRNKESCMAGDFHP